MDRDMVNCLHYLYQSQPLPAGVLDNHDPVRRMLWCQADTSYPLKRRGIIVEDGARNVLLGHGVFELIEEAESQLRCCPKPDYIFGYPFSAGIRAPGAPRPAFLAISYAPPFAAVKQAVLQAASAANFSCEVTGDLAAPGIIMDQVWQGIRGSDVVVADITADNPNVFYEIGLAHALGKEVVILSQNGAPPFDLRSARHIVYEPARLDVLTAAVEAAFRAVPARYPHEGAEPRY